MGYGNNDRIESIPNWLTPEQRRNAVRTVRGWEIPLVGSGVSGSTANGFDSAYVTRSSTNNVEYEVIVAMRNTSDSFLRGLTQDVPGLTTRAVDYAPYVSGVSGDVINVNQGITSYIPIFGFDVNSIDVPGSITLSGSGFTTNIQLFSPITAGLTAQIGSQFTSRSGITSSSFLRGSWPFGFGGLTVGAACIRVGSAVSTGGYSGTVSAFSNGLTATITLGINVSGSAS